MEKPIQAKEASSVFLDLAKKDKVFKVMFPNNIEKSLEFKDITLLSTEADKIQYLNSIKHKIYREYTHRNTLEPLAVPLVQPLPPTQQLPLEVTEVNKTELE